MIQRPLNRIVAALLLGMTLSSCAYAPWEKSVVAGATPEARLANAEAASLKEPSDMPARRDLHLTREQAIEEISQEAAIAVRQGKPEVAEAAWRRLLSIDPENQRARDALQDIQRDRRHQAWLTEAQDLFAKGNVEAADDKVRRILLENPSNAEALQLRERIQQKRAAAIRSEPPRLKPTSDKPVTLELREANIKMVFEALSKATGISFILDKDIKPDTKATVFIKKARIEDAIEMVLATNGLQKKALSETSALVFPNTAAKLKDYQDLVIRSFYLTNARSKDVAAMLKTMLKTKDVHVDERLNMLVIRDTPEVVRIAEKLVAANDLADPEVMLEMEVLEVSRNRLQQLGIQYPDTLTVAATGTSAALTLDALKNLDSSNVVVSPNPAVNFKKTTSDTDILANPRIRVRNNDKAKVHVGERVPVITTTSTANVGVSESVQYVDVGLKLEVEPRITLDDHVNIKIALEVANIVQTIKTANGGLVYQLGTRNANTMLRLKDGETQILAGLISDGERESANKLPGLGDIPLVGRLFSTHTDEKLKTEIVLAITPRIVNNIRRPESEIQEYWSGTETGITDRPQIVVAPGGGAPSRAMPNRPQPAVRTDPAVPETQSPQSDAAPVPSVEVPASRPAAEGEPTPAPDPAVQPDKP